MRNEIAAIIGSVLAIALVVFLMLVPAWDSVTALKAEIGMAKIDLEDAKETVQHMKILQGIYESNKDDFKKIETFLPIGLDLPALLVQTENLLASSRLLLEEIGFSEVKKEAYFVPAVVSSQDEFLAEGQAPGSPGVQVSKKSGNNFNAIGINLALRGDYQAIKDYLANLEKNMRLMDVVSLGISQANQNEDTGILNLELNVNAYYQ